MYLSKIENGIMNMAQRTSSCSDSCKARSGSYASEFPCFFKEVVYTVVFALGVLPSEATLPE